MKNIQIILNAILSKNVFEYILVDTDLHVINASLGIEKYLGTHPQEGDDILEYLPELVGNEDEIKTIFAKKYCLYSLESVYKNEYYVNISIEYCNEKTAIILLHNITANTTAKQKLLQYSNESSLLYSTLQKVLDNQNVILFVTNQDEKIEFANQKLIDYFKAKDMQELKNMDLRLYQYYDRKVNGYNEFYKEVYMEEDSIIIGDDVFLIQATQIEMTHKLFTLTKVTEMYKKKQSLEMQTQTDSLTQTYTKSYFDSELEKELQENRNVALIVLDIDDFKSINDLHGHPAGDAALQEFATLIKDHLTQDELFARWGGEEFLILLKRTNEEAAIEKIEALRKTIEAHEFETVKHITASFGIAYADEKDDINTFLLRADKALYKAKENGKNRVIFKKL